MELGQKPMGLSLPKVADELGGEPQERSWNYESPIEFVINWLTPLCLLKLGILKRSGFA